jgi:hypothetical protein
MPVRCFTRTEKNGIHILFPLEGPMKYDCLFVNETVWFVYQQLQAGLPIDALTRVFIERAQRLSGTVPSADGNGSGNGSGITPSPLRTSEERLRFDLYRILLSLRDRKICDYDFDGILAQLPQGKVLKGKTQVMPMALVRQTAEFLKQSVAAEGPVRPFYGNPAPQYLTESYFDPELVTRRHLDQVEVYFLGIDKRGEIEACISVRGFTFQPASLTMFYAAARHDSSEQFETIIGTHFARLCGLLTVVSLSAKLRFQHAVGAATAAYVHPNFERMIGELGFRRAFYLADELGPGTAYVAYDRALF